LRNKVSPGEYLAFLSVKYKVDPDKLFYALVSAGENQESTCGELSLKFREKLQNKIVLLITKGSKVVAQFPIPNEFLSEQSNPIKNSKTNMLRRHKIKNDDEPYFLHIIDLRTGMKKVNVKARVLEIAKPVVVFTRFGNYASVANALIADETGTIKLCMWNEQINSVSVGGIVQIENASVSTFRGERQLRIGKKGLLSEVKEMSCHQKKTQNLAHM
jgi:replication factor A1